MCNQPNTSGMLHLEPEPHTVNETLSMRQMCPVYLCSCNFQAFEIRFVFLRKKHKEWQVLLWCSSMFAKYL